MTIRGPKETPRMRIAPCALLMCCWVPVATTPALGQSTNPSPAENEAQASAPTTPAAGQQAPPGDEITAVPNRPTITSAAEVVQRGVLEIEYGFEGTGGHPNIN